MRNNTKLSLVDIPWPISILKFNQRVDQMQPGERLMVVLNDVDAKENLVMLLDSMSDLKFDLFDSDGYYRLNIIRDPVS